MTLVRFLAGHVTFDLHIGSLEPPSGTAAIGPDSGPAIGPTEAPSVLACFNGGFKVHDHPGGIVTWGQPLTTVVPGLGTFLIDAAGHGTVGVWGQGLPTLADPALNVRQNLQPLIAQGQVSPRVDDIAAWGYTYGGGTRVARSGLGEDAAGNIIYVASMSTAPGRPGRRAPRRWGPSMPCSSTSTRPPSRWTPPRRPVRPLGRPDPRAAASVRPVPGRLHPRLRGGPGRTAARTGSPPAGLHR